LPPRSSFRRRETSSWRQARSKQERDFQNARMALILQRRQRTRAAKLHRMGARNSSPALVHAVDLRPAVRRHAFSRGSGGFCSTRAGADMNARKQRASRQVDEGPSGARRGESTGGVD
jgi:hypothetical protein